MVKVIPFPCVRPAEGMAETIAALPYDVYNREEAKQVVSANPQSFLAIDRAETSFPDEVDTYDVCVYQKASEMLQDWIQKGAFVEDEKPCYYVYELTMDGRTQRGIVGCSSIDDYEQSIIKKHENTRADKELDRICHVDTCSAQTGPIFLAYRNNAQIRQAVEDAMKDQTAGALYDFVAEDGVRHTAYRIAEEEHIFAIQKAFADMEATYIADGHHRAASAVKVGQKRRAQHPDYDGTEEFNYFLSVLFPDDELYIMDYNRVVKDLNGMDSAAFLQTMRDLFVVEGDGTKDCVHPAQKGQFSMYLDGNWYLCTMKPEDIPDDAVRGLDVSVLQEKLLAPVLGIADPKTDKRIDFVGGIRGLKELERRCQEDCAVAFAMYPTSIQELFAVADAGLLMPPKSTWFEPKLRSGLFIHKI